MQVRVQDVIEKMDEIAPPRLAMEKDVIGLQVGRRDKVVHKIWLALDASPSVIESAVKANVDMLITHHALLYRPLTVIDTATPRGRAIQAALAADLTIFNAHTNLDVVEGGVNDVLATIFGLQNVDVLDALGEDKYYKFVVFVPETHVDAVRHALGESGAGHIGNYSHCTFAASGTGSFLPLQGTSPFIGEIGKLELVSEYRLETIVPASARENVLAAVRAVHPYEEMAYDWYPLEMTGKKYGIGRIGDLDAPMKLGDFARLVRDRLGLTHVRFGGDPEFVVERVAVLGGSGSRWIRKALKLGAQVFVTSDCDHHSVADAWDDGISVIDTTHAAMERPVLQIVQDKLKAALPKNVIVEIAPVREDPFQWI